MPRRRCLDWPAAGCAGYTTSGSRCEHCRAGRRAIRRADQDTAAAIVAAHPRCQCTAEGCHGRRQPCGATEDLTADHVVPLAAGGTHDGPRQVLCRHCNSKKKDR